MRSSNVRAKQLANASSLVLSTPGGHSGSSDVKPLVICNFFKRETLYFLFLRNISDVASHTSTHPHLKPVGLYRAEATVYMEHVHGCAFWSTDYMSHVRGYVVWLLEVCGGDLNHTRCVRKLVATTSSAMSWLLFARKSSVDSLLILSCFGSSERSQRRKEGSHLLCSPT